MRVHSSQPTGLAAAFDAAIRSPKNRKGQWEIVDRFFGLAVEHQDKPTLSHLVWHLVGVLNVRHTDRHTADDRRSMACVSVCKYLGRRDWQKLAEVREPSKYLSRSIRNALSKTSPKGDDATGPEHKYPPARLPKPSDATLEYRDDLHTLTDRALRDQITTFQGGGTRTLCRDAADNRAALAAPDVADLYTYTANRLGEDDRLIFESLRMIVTESHDLSQQEIDLRIALETGIAVSTVTKRRRALVDKVRASLIGGKE